MHIARRNGSRRPRRQLGRRRVITGLAAVLVVALLAACSGQSGQVGVQSATDVSTAGTADTPASCAQSPNPAALVPGSAKAAAGATTVGDPASEALTIGETIAEGVVQYSNGPSSLVGWALDELLGSGQSGDLPPDLQTQLGNLSGQLQIITNDLNTIEGQLATINNAIKDSTYQTEIADLTGNHVSPILAMWQRYCNIVNTKDTTKSTITQLADDVLNPATGMRDHVTAIVEAFKGNPTTGDVPLPGMFATFVIDQGVATFDDRPIYSTSMQAYTAYFVNLAIMGMSLMIESQHQQGDDVAAQATLTDLWTDIRDIYQAGGTSITDQNVVVHVPTGTVWARTPLCVSSQVSANAIIYQNAQGTGPIQQAIYDSVIDAWTIGNNGGGGPVPPPQYGFAAGDAVCALGWDPDDAAPSTWVPAAIDQSPIAKNALSDGTADPSSIWRDPTADDFTALVSARGGATPQAYLNQNGFTIPPTTGANGVTQLAYGFWRNSNSGYFDAADGSSTCLFASGCAAGVFPGFLPVITPTCWLGAASYKGLPKPCGTAWIDPIWPASPPPPTSPTSTSASASATSGSATATS